MGDSEDVDSCRIVLPLKVVKGAVHLLQRHGTFSCFFLMEGVVVSDTSKQTNLYNNLSLVVIFSRLLLRSWQSLYPAFLCHAGSDIEVGMAYIIKFILPSTIYVLLPGFERIDGGLPFERRSQIQIHYHYTYLPSIYILLQCYRQWQWHGNPLQQSRNKCGT